MHFMSYWPYYSRRFRAPKIPDEGVREAVVIGIDTSVPRGCVVRTLDRLIEWRGEPDAFRVDNGPEYMPLVYADWRKDDGAKLNYIQRDKVNDNSYIEHFNRTYRHEVLSAYVFESLRDVREITRACVTEYIPDRSHDSFRRIRPAVFRRQIENARNSTSELSN